MEGNELTTTGSKKSSWKKPERLIGYGLLGVGGLMFLDKALPFLIAIMENTIYAGFLFGVIGLIAFILLDPKFQTAMSYLYFGMIRKAVGILVEIDPIAILETHVLKLKVNLEKMATQISKLSGEIQKLKIEIDKNNKDIANNKSIAQTANKAGNRNQITLASRKIGRLDNSNLTLGELLKKMELLYNVLKKMYTNASLLIEDTEDEVKMKKRQLKSVTAAHSALSSAMSILRGNVNDQMLVDLANEALIEDIGAKIGEMDNFMNMTDSIMQGIDFQNLVFEQKGFDLLAQWEAQADSLLLGSDKQRLLSEVEVTALPVSEKKSNSRWAE